MAHTNPKAVPHPLRYPTTFRVSNPTNESEVDGHEDDSLLSESFKDSPCDEEYDSDDLSLKELVRWRAGSISPCILLEPHSKLTTPSPPPGYSPFTQPALGGMPASRNGQDNEESDINYPSILSPPPRVFCNPHPGCHDYDFSDRPSVGDFLEDPGHDDDVIMVKEGPVYSSLNINIFGIDSVRPPTWALKPIKPLRIRRRNCPDPPVMYWDPTSQSVLHSYSIYSQETGRNGVSQYRSSTLPSMKAPVSMPRSATSAFIPTSFSSSHVNFEGPIKHYPSTTNITSNRSTPMVQASNLVSSQYHRSRRRSPLGHGLQLIDEQKKSTFTLPGQCHRKELLSREPLRSHEKSFPNRSSAPPHPWVSRGNERRERCPQIQVAVSRQPGRHPPMRPKPRIGNRNAKRMSYSSDGTRDWSSDLCMFCDHNLGTCCAALWCPCIIYARNKKRIEHLYAEERVHPKRGGTCSDDCAIHACMSIFCLFGWAIQIPNRAAVRRRYDIEGDCIGDCAAAFFCSPCELSQESREIDLEERLFGDVRTWSRSEA